MFKNFWWEKYGANYGQNLTNLCAIFCPWCFLHSQVRNDHEHSSVRFWKISIHTPIQEGHMFAQQVATFFVSIHTPIQEWQRFSTKNHIFVWFIFLPYFWILAHKRAFFNINFTIIPFWNLQIQRWFCTTSSIHQNFMRGEDFRENRTILQDWYFMLTMRSYGTSDDVFWIIQQNTNRTFWPSVSFNPSEMDFYKYCLRSLSGLTVKIIKIYT